MVDSPKALDLNQPNREEPGLDAISQVWEEFRLSVSEQTMSKELRGMGFRKLSARPRHHAKDEAAAAVAFKTYGPPRLQEVSAI
jgi:hypothetical protein